VTFYLLRIQEVSDSILRTFVNMPETNVHIQEDYCEISGSQGGEYGDENLLGCCTV
jgi:hypothetical protein